MEASATIITSLPGQCGYAENATVTEVVDKSTEFLQVRCATETGNKSDPLLTSDIHTFHIGSINSMKSTSSTSEC